MATRKPRTNNAIKAQARAHQKANPGTTYTAAREAVVRASTSTGEKYRALDRIVGQPAAKESLHATFMMEEVRTERARREHATRWADADPRMVPPFAAPRSFPKVHIFGPSGTGRTTSAHVIYDTMVLPAASDDRHAPLVTVGASQLIGRSIGEAQSRIQPLVERAEGGMLLIEDGDFLLGQDDHFRTEAITVLSEEIRLLSHNLAVCIISYTRSVNTEIGARFLRGFPSKVPLVSLDAPGAFELAIRFARARKMVLEDTAAELIAHRVEEYGLDRDNGFPLIDVVGNARFVNSVVEGAEANLMMRLASRNMLDITDDELRTLTAEDVTLALEDARR